MSCLSVRTRCAGIICRQVEHRALGVLRTAIFALCCEEDRNLRLIFAQIAFRLRQADRYTDAVRKFKGNDFVASPASSGEAVEILCTPWNYRSVTGNG